MVLDYFLVIRNRYPRIFSIIIQIIFSTLRPFDFILRLITGTSDRPHLIIRRHAGPINKQERYAAEYLSYLKLLCNIKSNSRILDIGCSYGIMAIYLKDYIGTLGQYTGIDICDQDIVWANNNITKKYPNLKFIHINVNNPLYNPKGEYTANKFHIPLPDSCYDSILLKSVFTHMKYSEVHNYIKEIKRLLSSSGICLATLFLVNDEQIEMQQKGESKINFYKTDIGYFGRLDIPEYAVAYDEKMLKELLDIEGLEVSATYYGNWSGRDNGLSFQDIFLIKHAF